MHSPNRTGESRSVLFIVLTGMALGVLAGRALVAWLEHRDGRFYDWRVIERRLGLPVLANIPGKKGRTAHLFKAHSPSGQAFVELRTALASGLSGTNNVVLLASPIRGHGLDMVVANLAASAARANITTTVVVVDDNSHLTDLVGLPTWRRTCRRTNRSNHTLSSEPASSGHSRTDGRGLRT